MQIGIALFVQLDMLRGHMRLYPASAKIMDYLKRRHVEVAQQEAHTVPDDHVTYPLDRIRSLITVQDFGHIVVPMHIDQSKLFEA